MNNPTKAPLILLGEIRPTAAEASALPLEATRVTGQILGLLAAVTVTQRFGNPLAEAAELEYLFPLPHAAAVTGFELRIGDRKVVGRLEELEKAQAQYETARDQGQRAALLDQRRANLFAVRLANVLPGEKIEAVLRYQERIQFRDGTFEFVFPMGITPKYHSAEHPGESAGVEVSLARAGERIGPVEIDLAVDAGAPVADPASPSHPLDVTRLDERRFQVRLSGEQLPDHDFVLRYAARVNQVVSAAWLDGGEDGETFLAAIFPPKLDESSFGPPRPREFVFVLDRSGSMSGEPIAQARNALRACLRSLQAGDTFRILLFDDQLEWYQARQASPVEQAEIDRADAFLAQVEGRGGTEIVAALEAALGLAEDKEHTRFVVFLTDGAVSAEERALDQIRRRLGKARLFSFGIGPSVNRALLSRLAALGRGAAEFLQLDEDIEGAIIRFQDRVSFPALSDLALEWHGARAWDVYPTLLPDLYIGQPLELSGRFRRQGKGPAGLTVHARLEGKPVDLALELPAQSQAAEPLVSRAWARARVDDLLEQQALDPRKGEALRAQILALALDHGLVTPYTAFVAVDEDVANAGGKVRLLAVAQPLPQGLQREPFIGGGVLHMAAFSAGAMPPSPQARPFTSFRKMMPASLADRPDQDAGTPSIIPQVQPLADLPKHHQRESLLRWLARTQSLDGSWGADPERTAAALLGFVRGGNTTVAGSYRVAVRRAVAWLEGAAVGGLAAVVRALALLELARATGLAAQQAAAQKALESLPDAGILVEGARGWTVSDAALPGLLPASVDPLRNVRAAVLTGVPLLESGQGSDEVYLTWQAALPEK